MMKHLVCRAPLAALVVVVIAAATMGATVGAQTEVVSTLPTTEAQGFLGEWTLSMELQGNPVEMKLEIADSAGTVSATLTSPRAREPQLIRDIRRVGEHLKLSWQRPFNGRPLTLQMELAREGAMLAGSFGDTNGMFETEITGAVPIRADTATTTRGSDSPAQAAPREPKRN